MRSLLGIHKLLSVWLGVVEVAMLVVGRLPVIRLLGSAGISRKLRLGWRVVVLPNLELLVVAGGRQEGLVLLVVGVPVSSACIRVPVHTEAGVGLVVGVVVAPIEGHVAADMTQWLS